jgi:hypothetical protein
VMLSRVGDDAASLQTSGLALDIARDTTGADNRLYLQLAVQHAMSLAKAARRDEAMALLHEVLPQLEARSAPGVDAVNHAYALSALAGLLLEAGDAAGASDAYARAEGIVRPHAAYFMVVYHRAMGGLIRARAARRDAAGAQEASARYRALLDELQLPDDARWRSSLASLLANLP